MESKECFLEGKRRQITGHVQQVTHLHSSAEFETAIPQLSAPCATNKYPSNATLNVTHSSTPYSTTHFLVGKAALLRRCTWPVSSLPGDEQQLPAPRASPLTRVPGAQAVPGTHRPALSRARCPGAAPWPASNTARGTALCQPHAWNGSESLPRGSLREGSCQACRGRSAAPSFDSCSSAGQ